MNLDKREYKSQMYFLFENFWNGVLQQIYHTVCLYMSSSVISSLFLPIALNAANVSPTGQLITSCHVAFKGAARGGDIVNNNQRPGELNAVNPFVKSSVAGFCSHSHFAQHGLDQVPVVSCRTYACHWLYQHAIGKVSDVFIGHTCCP